MIIRSALYGRFVMLGILIFFSIGIYELLINFDSISPLWSIAIIIMGFYALRIAIDLYVSVFSSPLWVELRNQTVTVKLPLREVFQIQASDIRSVVRKTRGFHEVQVSDSAGQLVLYFDDGRFKHLNEFLRELKSVNPNCDIESSLI